MRMSAYTAEDATMTAQIVQLVGCSNYRLVREKGSSLLNASPCSISRSYATHSIDSDVRHHPRQRGAQCRRAM